MDAKIVFEEFQDYLAPKLDTYEQAIYLYIFRHSRLGGKMETIIGFKSNRRKMALGIGVKGTPMSEHVCYEKLRSLETKGCIKILGTERGGTKIKLFLPSEVPGLIPPEEAAAVLNLEEMDFFDVPENRLLILRREGNKCFYCFRALDSSNYVIEHITSRPSGNNSYRNVVAACRNCNNQKNDVPVEEFLRGLYRRGFLSDADFDHRIRALQLLKSGGLKPDLASSIHV